MCGELRSGSKYILEMYQITCFKNSVENKYSVFKMTENILEYEKGIYKNKISC